MAMVTTMASYNVRCSYLRAVSLKAEANTKYQRFRNSTFRELCCV